ncbi:probable transport accessory protein MmpS3 [Zingiber officinale]|uniref:probable transport accessory protein MmpS3 n=1 Tax=Zingiber officinale TaxID=94328 RepID=UPI001C4D2885|nr:probable transport accessory protein MmpS3 [Zingiber officinale]
MTVAYSRISSRSFTKTGLVGGPAGVRWRDGRAFDDAEEDIPEPASPTFEETVDTRLEELTMEVADLRSMMETMVHRQTSMQATIDTLVDLVSSWVTGNPSQSAPSTAPVPQAEDAAGADTEAVPAPATTSAPPPAAAADPTPPGDDLIEFFVPL